jgi:hypothetical protein
MEQSRVPGAIATPASDSTLYEACMQKRGWQRKPD